MSGWGHSNWPLTRVSGRDWTQKVFEIAASVGHCLSPHGWDQGIEGRFHASHAEKQLIAYFLDRHVFLPEDKSPDSRFDEEIEQLESEIKEMTYIHPAVNDLFHLRKDKKNLEHEFFVKDDPLPGEEYNEALVEDLKRRIASLNEQDAALEKKTEVQDVKAREHQVQILEHEKDVHCRLNRLSKKAPENTLTLATIFISSPKYTICDDCALFKDKVNRELGLSIKLIECTE